MHGRIRTLDPEILYLTGATLDYWQEPGSPRSLDQQKHTPILLSAVCRLLHPVVRPQRLYLLPLL